MGRGVQNADKWKSDRQTQQQQTGVGRLHCLMNEANTGIGNGGLKRAGREACCCKKMSVKDDVSILPACTC